MGGAPRTAASFYSANMCIILMNNDVIKIFRKVVLGPGLNGNAMFYKTFTYFYVSEAKPLCFSLCSQMFDDVERC